MTGRFADEAKLVLGLPHGVEVVLHQLGEPGVLEGLGEGYLLLVELAHFFPILGVIPVLFFPLVQLLYDLNLRVEGRLPWCLCGLPCYSEPTSIRVGDV